MATGVLLLLAGGTTVFANTSMPDEPLYGVKLATEQVRITFAHSSVDKAELYAKLADRRVFEIERMAEKNKPEQIDKAAQLLNTDLVKLVGTQETRSLSMAPDQSTSTYGESQPTAVPAPPPPTVLKGLGAPPATDEQATLRETITSQATTNSEKLHALLSTTPESARPALLRAIAISDTDYQIVLDSLQ